MSTVSQAGQRVYYSPRYIASIGDHIMPIHKFALVHQGIVDTGLPVRHVVPEPVSDDDLLRVHTREYLDAAGRPARSTSRIDAWLAGTDLSRVEARGEALSALSAPTALRALGECSRLVRALGHRGLLLLFEGAEVLTRLSVSRRDGAFTVLRELVDNADGARGLVAAQLWVGATPLLYDGQRGIALSGPLASRVLAPAPADDDLPPPHRPRPPRRQ